MKKLFDIERGNFNQNTFYLSTEKNSVGESKKKLITNFEKDLSASEIFYLSESTSTEASRKLG